MKIVQFAASLLARTDKEKIVEDLRITQSELEQVIQANYDHASAFFRSNRFASVENREITDVFYRNFKVRGTKQSSIVGEIASVIPSLLKNITYLSDQIEKVLEAVAINEGLSVKKTVLIRGAEHMSFITRYAIDLLNYIYVNEAGALNSDVVESMRLAPAQVIHVEKHVATFATLLSQYAQKPEDFQKEFLRIPDVVISSKTSTALQGLYKENEIDPFAGAYVQGFMGSPIYHLRLMVAEWQAARYRTNKDKKKMLELRLLHLKLLQEKKNDPKIEKEIEYMQGRVDKISAYLREVEQDLDEQGAY